MSFLGKNWYKKYEDHKRKAIWFVVGIFTFLITAIITVNIPDRKVHFFGTLIFGSIFALFAFSIGLFLLRTAFRDKISIGNRIFFIFLSIDSILVSAFMVYDYSKEYQDIPYIVTSKYENKVGVLTNFYVSPKFSKGGTEFEIDGTHFYFGWKVKGFFIKGKRYRVEYLPHSKYVMNVFK